MIKTYKNYIHKNYIKNHKKKEKPCEPIDLEACYDYASKNIINIFDRFVYIGICRNIENGFFKFSVNNEEFLVYKFGMDFDDIDASIRALIDNCHIEKRYYTKHNVAMITLSIKRRNK